MAEQKRGQSAGIKCKGVGVNDEVRDVAGARSCKIFIDHYKIFDFGKTLNCFEHRSDIY